MSIVKLIASNQQENVDHLASEIKDVKKLLESNSADCVRAEPSKQALVSALDCKYLLYALNAVKCPYVRSYVCDAGRGQLSSE